MKQYKKTHENISKYSRQKQMAAVSSPLGSLDELARRFRNFYRDAHIVLFDLTVKQIWMEHQFLYHGARRARSGNGIGIDSAYGYFMKAIVGISQKPLTDGIAFVAMPTYFKDFFPNFSDHDPFKNPEMYKYPYEHVTLDHLAFVYQCDNRLEMLQEAENKKMNIKDFCDWAVNWVLCYNEEQGQDVYSIKRTNYTPYIKKNILHGRKK